MYLPTPRRYQLFGAAISIIALAVFLRTAFQPVQSFSPSAWSSWFSSSPVDRAVEARVQRSRAICDEDDPFEREYGRTNLRLSRGYEGSHHRVRQLLHKSLRGEHLTIAAIGGSITAGHHVEANEVWFYRLGQWLNGFVGDDVEVTQVNGAAPATGSDYYSFCFPLHIPSNSDLVLVELAVNDEGIPEHVENMENLLRGLLDMPNKPAVVLVEALAFSNGGMGGGGGRMHLPVAQYFDVPVINQRHPLANHFARYPQLLRSYFVENYWGDPDTRHINARGHRDLGMLIGSLLRDVTCEMLAEETFSVPPSIATALSSDLSATPLNNNLGLSTDGLGVVDAAFQQDAQIDRLQSSWPEQSRSWRKDPAEGEAIGLVMPGVWTTPTEYGLLPRMRVLDGWNEDISHSVPPFHPTCLSTRSTVSTFNLTPIAGHGWEPWVHPEHLDKPYLVAQTPGARVSFELETSLGKVKMYSLRSKTFGLGTIECWADADRERAVKVVGWWDNGELNIGRFVTIRDDLSPGRHVVSCELLDETSDPGGGHEFRMISMMSV